MSDPKVFEFDWEAWWAYIADCFSPYASNVVFAPETFKIVIPERGGSHDAPAD